MEKLKERIMEETRRIRVAEETDVFTAFAAAKRQVLSDATAEAQSIEELKVVILAMLNLHGPRG